MGAKGQRRFIERILRPPHYGLGSAAQSAPTVGQLWLEFVRRHDVVSDRRNWITWVFALSTLGVTAAMACHWAFYATPSLVALGMVYAIFATSHATFYLHRFGAHRAFAFRNGFWRFVGKNLAVKVTTEEIYTISHAVHHALADQPGDPHNPSDGWLNCALSISNHHPVAWDLSEADYARLTKMIDHTGVRVNSYAQYRTWGTLCHPGWTLLEFAVNWGLWASVFWALGGWALVATGFGYVALYTWGIRNFNYFAHGGGQDRRRAGVDFHRGDLSRNHWWPGFVGGEWHNNHHLYPRSARSGFLPHQIDFAWMMVVVFRALGGVVDVQDAREDFLRDHMHAKAV